MAFADHKGKILINEDAAAVDIRNLEESKALLLQALDLMTQTEQRGAEFRGDTGERIVAHSIEIRADIKKQIDNIETTINAIKGVVARYQRIDKEIVQQINTTL